MAARMKVDDVPSATSSIQVARPPGEVWAAIADVRRMVTWSPEASGVRTRAAAPLQVGDVFLGSNRHGIFRWTTRCEVVVSDPGEEFTFDVSYLRRPVSRWSYRVEARPDGCVVTETTTDRRDVTIRLVGAVGTGVARRAPHNQRTMHRTLEAMKGDLERPAT